MAQKVLLFEAAALLLVFSFMLQSGLMFEKAQFSPTQEVALWPGEFITGFMASGFNAVAADLLWLKADSFWHEGMSQRIFPLFRVITLLEPGFLSAWPLGAWHLSYNLSAEAESDEEALKLVEKGIGFLKEGLAKNPRRYELYFELGWIYYDRLKDYEKAADYFKQAVRYPHPAFLDRLLARVQEKLDSGAAVALNKGATPKSASEASRPLTSGY